METLLYCVPNHNTILKNLFKPNQPPTHPQRRHSWSLPLASLESKVVVGTLPAWMSHSRSLWLSWDRTGYYAKASDCGSNVCVFVLCLTYTHAQAFLLTHTELPLWTLDLIHELRASPSLDEVTL